MKLGILPLLQVCESIVVSMANMLDNVAVRSIAKHRNKLMSLVESTKKRKKKKQKTWAVPPSNIEHLVFKKIPTSPIDPGPNLNGTRLQFCDDTPTQDGYDQEEEESCDELEIVSTSLICFNISCIYLVAKILRHFW
ncbi:uncharacterized protein NPIL_455161 [Nephila pilipes]|uniref:Uncharacterized protein n=1 Tax=Nephila pilipes TaxID=299642 RepID=A0A8X6UB95_NEPPI|nr:uncharacterized protein NPIL_455161 [Nephila pilipes]